MGYRARLDAFTRAASHLRRLLETLGLRRRPRDVPTLAQYLQSKADEAEETYSGSGDGPEASKLSPEAETPTGALASPRETPLP